MAQGEPGQAQQPGDQQSGGDDVRSSVAVGYAGGEGGQGAEQVGEDREVDVGGEREVQVGQVPHISRVSARGRATSASLVGGFWVGWGVVEEWCAGSVCVVRRRCEGCVVGVPGGGWCWWRLLPPPPVVLGVGGACCRRYRWCLVLVAVVAAATGGAWCWWWAGARGGVGGGPVPVVVLVVAGARGGGWRWFWGLWPVLVVCGWCRWWWVPWSVGGGVFVSGLGGG